MKKTFILLSIISCIFAEVKLGGVTYFDFSANDETSGFNFQRQYFGYGGDVSDKVSYKILFDVGRTGQLDGEDSRLVAFLKKAQINYKSSWGKFNFGLIGMNTYNIQEKNWGYRFIEKSTIDKNKFSGTADIGVGYSKKFFENLNFSLLLVNGEGYKKPQEDKYYKVALNTTYGEGNLLKKDGYNVGIVYTTEQTASDPNTMTSIFGGFAGRGLRVGGEYDMQTKDGSESNIISMSANYSINEKSWYKKSINFIRRD